VAAAQAAPRIVDAQGTGIRDGACVSDILSQGQDRTPRPWRRRLAVLAVVAGLVAVLVLTHLPRHPAARPRRPPAPVVAGPDGITGPTLPWAASLRLPVAAEHPALLSPGPGRLELIGGLPLNRAGYQFTPLGGGWAIQATAARSVPRAVCDACAGAPQPVYFLPERGRSASLAAPANAVAPAATGQAMWLTTYPPGVSLALAAGTAREVGPAGQLLRRAVRLPAGYMIVQGTVSGLLLAPVAPRPGASGDEVWNPATRTAVTAGPAAHMPPGAVVVASATQLAVAPPCTGTCRVSILDLAGGRSGTVQLAPGNSVANAAFSPDGRYLALQVNAAPGGADGGSATQLEVVAVATGRLTSVPDTSLSSDALIGFGWPPGGDRLVAELSFTTKVQLASWLPGATQLAVTVLRPGTGAESVVTG
jgi:hypothetical protein